MSLLKTPPQPKQITNCFFIPRVPVAIDPQQVMNMDFISDQEGGQQTRYCDFVNESNHHFAGMMSSSATDANGFDGSKLLFATNFK